MNNGDDCFAGIMDCVDQFKKSRIIRIVTDDKVVGMVWGSDDDWTWRVGGGNGRALSKSEAIHKLLDSLEK
jgi:hypothetical protein